jgi:hypothetical protein
MDSISQLAHSLIDLSHFNHKSCDALLAKNDTTIVDAFYPDRRGFERNTVYSRLFFAVAWEALMLMSLFGLRYAKQQRAKAILSAVILGFLAIVGLIVVGAQLNSMSEYDSACRRLLGAQARPLATARTSAPEIGIVHLSI